MTESADTAGTLPGPGDAAEFDDAPELAGTWTNVGAAVAPLILGLAGAAGAVELGLGELVDPGPGLWPFIICLAIVVCSLGLLIGGHRFHDAEGFTRLSLRVVAAVLGVSALVAVLPYVGFEIPSAVLVLAWLRFFGGEPWWKSAVLAAGITIALWLLFVLLLGIQIPHLF